MEAHQQSPAELSKLQFHEFTYRDLRTNDHTLDDNLPAHLSDQNLQNHQNLQNLQNLPAHLGHQNHQISSNPSPRVSLGALDTLPIEVLHCILTQLDLPTLTSFQLVNHCAWHVVALLPPFKAIDTHARNVMRGILSISMGPWVTLETLHRALCTAECASCGAFGGYLYLLTCTRVCFLCFTQHNDYLPLLRLHATQRFALTRPLLDTLAVPTMRSRAGTYSPSELRRTPVGLVDGESARQAGVALHGSVAAMEARVREAAERQLLKRAATSHAMSPVRRPPGTKLPPWDGWCDNPLRFMAIVRAPWLDRSSQSVEWGAYCQGCTDEDGGDGDFYTGTDVVLDFRRMFNVASFDAHLRQHGAIKKWKHRLDSQYTLS